MTMCINKASGPSFSLTNGHGSWGGPAPVDRNTLATARLIVP